MKTNILFGAAALLFALSACGDDPKGGEEPGPQPPAGNTEDRYESVSYKKLPTDATWLEGETLIVDNVGNYTPVARRSQTEWGGRPGSYTFTQVTGTEGFFRVGKIGQRWYLIAPDNSPVILRGTQDVRPGTTDAYKARFATDVAWAAEAGQFLVDNNLNATLQGGLRPAVMPAEYKDLILNPVEGRKIAYAEIVYMLRSYLWDYNYSKNFSFKFDDAVHNRLYVMFEETYLDYLDQWAAQVCAMYKDDVHFIGYMLDNELNYKKMMSNTNGSQGLDIRMALDMPEGSGIRKFAEKFVADRGYTPQDVITQAVYDEFREVMADYYFKTTTEAIRRHDPNHLILGNRIYVSNMYDERVMKACAKYCDVVSINYYNAWSVDPAYIANLKSWFDKPFIVTEFYTKGADANVDGEPYSNRPGGGWIVKTQKDRGKFHQNIGIGLIAAQNCVGWYHFNYVDTYEDAKYQGYTNKGMLALNYYPYVDFMEYVKQLNDNVYGLADHYDAK